MTAPNLLHPVAVQIEPLNRTATIVDDDYREPIQAAARGARVTVSGQISWVISDKMEPAALGAYRDAEGYVLFRTVDLRAASITIQQGDRFVAFGTGLNQRAVDLYVVGVQPMGHYPDQGGATLIRAFFKDRSPAHQNPGGL